MDVVELARFPLTRDLSHLQRGLQQADVPHRIYEEGREQVLVVDVAYVKQAEHAVTLFEEGKRLDVLHPAPQNKLPIGLLWRNFPVTLSLISLSIAGFLLVYMQAFSSVGWLLFQPTIFDIGNIRYLAVSDGLASGQFWRLITPIFLHFGPLHVVFNCLWAWLLGRRIEQVESSNNLLMLVLVSGVISNTLQYTVGGAAVFGGLSGVIYGLLAYCAVTQWLQPQSPLALNPSIYIIMLVFLLLGTTGLMGLFGGGAIANAAHFGGLIAGAVWALLVRQISLFK